MENNKPLMVQIGLRLIGPNLTFINTNGSLLDFGEERIVTAPREDRVEFMGKKYNFQVSVDDGQSLRMFPIAGKKDPEGFFQWTHVLIECKSTDESLNLSMNPEWKSEFCKSN